MHIPTADELRERGEGQSVLQHATAVKTARNCHYEKAQWYERRQSAGSDLNQSEQRAWKAHLEQVDELSHLLEDIENSPEGRVVDYSQLIHTGDDAGPGYHTGGGNTYRPDDHRTSWVRDLIAANLRGNPDARERLTRNNTEVSAEFRALSNTGTAGGEWVPPLHLIREGMRLARAGRVVANQLNTQTLPAGTDSITLPRIATGTAAAQQATENTAVQATDATTGSITADIATIAGQQILSVQLVDQSPVSMDQLILQDLLAALAVEVDKFAIANNATNKLGLLSVSGVNAVTYTDENPTVAELYPKVADAIQQISTGRFLPPSKVFMHPRRWAWFTAAADTTGRPSSSPPRRCHPTCSPPWATSLPKDSSGRCRACPCSSTRTSPPTSAPAPTRTRSSSPAPRIKSCSSRYPAQTRSANPSPRSFRCCSSCTSTLRSTPRATRSRSA